MWAYNKQIGLSFTFHNVSINSYTWIILPPCTAIFTFHNVSINSFLWILFHLLLLHLHSTMFLLIPLQTVSITLKLLNLHSTMFLLIPEAAAQELIKLQHLHSTMFLLIRIRRGPCTCWKSFTFHNVSINSQKAAMKKAWSRIYIPQCFY